MPALITLTLNPALDLATTTGLGLSIVQTLVTTELQGSISMHARTDTDAQGAVAEIRVPLVADEMLG